MALTHSKGNALAKTVSIKDPTAHTGDPLGLEELKSWCKVHSSLACQKDRIVETSPGFSSMQLLQVETDCPRKKLIPTPA